MSWPLASHFSAMLQNPRIAFRDERLKRATIEKNQQNQPRPWAGAFAVVYKAIDPDSREPFALRVFTTESPERRERYDLISDYLKGRKLKCLVEFEYRDGSIRSSGDGKWYPLILMDWVQGETLFNWLRARAMEGNGQAITQAADRWLEAIQELNDASVAHGDLQHANIMVSAAGEIKLVDYDGMCVPALVGRRNLEVGVEPYQHPDRNATTLLSLDLDNFSALMIYVALRALSFQPALWQKYVEQQAYDKLLFRREDLQAPGQSALYRDLTAIGNADLTGLTNKLFALAQERMDDVPPLGQLVNSFGEVERFLVESRWDEAVALLNRRGHFRDAPARLRPLIHQAYEHVCRQQAWDKFLKIPPEVSEPIDRQLVEQWNEALFVNFPPAEQQRPRVDEARQRVQALDRLRHLIQQTAGAMSLLGEKKLASYAARLPSGYRHSLRERVRLARQRVAAFNQLDQAITAGTSESAIVAGWRAVVAVKCESFVSIEWGMRVAVAEERVPIFENLAKIPRNLPLHQRDRQVIALWNEQLMNDCPEAERWRPAYQVAVVRREVLKRLQAAIEAHDDTAILQWAGKRCLTRFPLPKSWIAAIRAARERLGRVESLLATLREASEAVEPAEMPEVAEAAEGVDAGNEPATPSTQYPLQSTQDVDAAAESGAPGAEYPVHSTQHAGAGESASPSTGYPVPSTQGPEAAADPGTLSTEHSVPSTHDAEPTSDEASEAASDDNAEETPEAAPAAESDTFDVAMVRAQAERFEPYRTQLTEWIRTHVLPAKKLSLGPAAGQASITPADEPEGHYRVEWTWPRPQMADACVLAICPKEPQPADGPEQAEAVWQASVAHDQWTAVGNSWLVPLEKGWEGNYVVVWPVVDVGFEKLVGHPLVLGQIGSRARRKWISPLWSRGKG